MRTETVVRPYGLSIVLAVCDACDACAPVPKEPKKAFEVFESQRWAIDEGRKPAFMPEDWADIRAQGVTVKTIVELLRATLCPACIINPGKSLSAIIEKRAKESDE